MDMDTTDGQMHKSNPRDCFASNDLIAFISEPNIFVRLLMRKTVERHVLLAVHMMIETRNQNVCLSFWLQVLKLWTAVKFEILWL